MKRILVIGFVIGLVLLQACKKDDDPTCTKEVDAAKLAAVDQVRLAADIEAIDAYLATNNITAQTEPNGVRYTITSLGTGTKVQCLENVVTVKTTGWLLKFGTVFQPEAEFSYKLNQLIFGWQLVLPLVPVGSKITAYIPSGYGYGVSGGANGKVPSNAILVFDIELIAVK
jgi:FKBP-type peptidyl-prolyl cis-trans isomerase FkpA